METNLGQSLSSGRLGMGKWLGEEAGPSDGVGDEEASLAGGENRVVGSQYPLLGQKVWNGPCLTRGCLQRLKTVRPCWKSPQTLFFPAWAESPSMGQSAECCGPRRDFIQPSERNGKPPEGFQ